MIVIEVSRCPPKLKGDLSKWFYELSPTTFVGSVNPRVRDHLWDRIRETIGDGSAVMAYTTHCEQRIQFKVYGYDWDIQDFDGLVLMKRPSKESREKKISSENIPSKKAASKDRMKASAAKGRYPPDFTLIDCETTGLDPESDLLLEVGALRVRNWVVEDYFSSLIVQEKQLADTIKTLTRLSDEEVWDKGMDELWVVSNLLEFIEDDLLIGYNVGFDISFIREACQRQNLKYSGNETLDLLTTAKRQLKELPNHKLATVASHFGVKIPQKHRAISDCFLTLSVLMKLKEICKNQ